MPSRDEIMAFLADNPGMAGKREIARHFGITGGARIYLKRLLREMADDGLLEKRQKRLSRPGDLPPVLVVLVTGRDSDGELLAEPASWDEDEHGTAPRILVLPDPRKSDMRAPGLGDRLLVRLTGDPAGEEATRAGRIIKLLDRQASSVLGILRQARGRTFLEPIDRKQKELEIDTSDLKGAADGDLVGAQVTKVGRYGLPRGRIVRRIGAMHSEMAVSEIALHTHGIPHDFPDRVIEAAENAKPATMSGREDWRKLPLITIDPADAKDHDDAVHAVADEDPANGGGYVATVAIADVAYYVRPGEPLDREAHLRGNSVYFPDRVIPMLPEALSNGLCSLKEGEDRPAMAVRMVFDKAGRKLRHSFHRVMMRSALKISYDKAQAAIDGEPGIVADAVLEEILKPLWAAYACLKRGREAREPLDLDLPERKIRLKPDGTVDGVYVPARLDAHKLIEEFMIQANVAAAETLEQHGVPLLYRVHDASSPEKLEALKEFLGTLGIRLASGGGLRPAAFNGILRKVVGTPEAELVNQVILRSQAQAEYSPQNIGHFGLNLRRYAHFTSPIRRYADLIVHRGLIRALKLGDDGLPDGMEGRLEMIGADVSAAERRAMLAERDTVDRLIALWLADQVGTRFNGRISGVVKSGLFIRLDDTGADGFVPASTIGDDYYHYDESSHSMSGRTTGETYSLGDRVEVRLVEAAPYAGALRFELLSEGHYHKRRSARERTMERNRKHKSGGAGRSPKGRPSKGRRK
ncbi:ribonuclease R [Stappia sp. WLB 29]|uniref:ribonuclease R n=1 Tax=Stappia sp. WLB 29 TaxID=2925220 RepID=UPI0024BE8DA3|nr:ribonuclease R [Stappia sp. WLB 29]